MINFDEIFGTGVVECIPFNNGYRLTFEHYVVHPPSPESCIRELVMKLYYETQN